MTFSRSTAQSFEGCPHCSVGITIACKVRSKTLRDNDYCSRGTIQGVATEPNVDPLSRFSAEGSTTEASNKMVGANGSEAGPETKPDLFEWHGAELIFIPLMMATGILGNSLVLYITHFRWKNSIFSFFIKVRVLVCMSC